MHATEKLPCFRLKYKRISYPILDENTNHIPPVRPESIKHTNFSPNV
jgi:hypothetical protein